MSEYKVEKSGGESISLKEIENGSSREESIESRNLRRKTPTDDSRSISVNSEIPYI